MPTVGLVGDVMLGRGVNRALATVDPASVWGSTVPILRATAAVIANLECAITPTESPWRRTDKVVHLRADPYAVRALEAGNVRLVNLANDHTLDHEAGGLLDTIGHLSRAGIGWAGAGRHLTEARQPGRLRVDGFEIAMLAATDNEPSYRAETGPGTNYTEIPPQREFLDWLGRSVRGLRADGVTLVVLSMHWGPNMVTRPSPAFRAFAETAVGMGVDLVWGHSAHVFQGVERIDGGVVCYDTGDFIDDYAVDREVHNDWSFLFLLDLASNGRLEQVRMVPVKLGFGRVDLATGPEAAAIIATMQERSRALGADGPIVDGRGLTLDLRSAGRH